MAREEIHLDMTFEQLCARIDAAADREPRDEPNLDEHLRPITDEQVLDRVRELERRTGKQLIFDRSERPGSGA